MGSASFLKTELVNTGIELVDALTDKYEAARDVPVAADATGSPRSKEMTLMLVGEEQIRCVRARLAAARTRPAKCVAGLQPARVHTRLNQGGHPRVVCVHACVRVRVRVLLAHHRFDVCADAHAHAHAHAHMHARIQHAGGRPG
ncbi:hypothetical protein EON67_05765 [archaeon]|nr:MAG: hypothetical protein EON67_05765 [archaeon]